MARVFLRWWQGGQRIIVVAALLVALYGAYFFHESLGWVVWRVTHNASAALALNAADPELLFAIGNYYFGSGAYDLVKARRYFNAALEYNPTLSGPHYQLARTHFVEGNFNDALEEINKELTLHPEFGRSHYVRGLIYGYNGRLADAETEFKAFLVWKKDSWAGNNDLAWIYFQEGKYIEARDAARTGLTIQPNNPWLLNSLGVALLNTGDTEGAKESFLKALSALTYMNERDWGQAYPGNNPTVYRQGFTQMKASIEANLKLLSGGDIHSVTQ